MTRRWMPNGMLVAALLLASSELRAQTDSTPRVGDMARVRTTVVDANRRAVRCEARVTAISGDTLVLQNGSRWGGCPRREYAPDAITSLQVQRGSRGSRLAHAGLGLAIGAGLGAAVGYFAGHDNCHSCEEEDLFTALTTFAGATVGGVTGTIVGAVLPAGPRWVTVPVRPPVRVAGLVVQPGVQLRAGR